MTDSYWNNASDPYRDPESGVLKNIPGIRDASALDSFEQRATSLRLDEALQSVSLLPVNFALWKSLHRVLFQDVYAWAGHVRTVQIAKGTTVFAMPEHIEAEAERLLAEMEKEKLTAAERPRFVARLPYYFAELNVLHPFREGNGRTQKLVFDEIARRASLIINWEEMEADLLLEALIVAFESQEYGKLENLFQIAIAAQRATL